MFFTKGVSVVTLDSWTQYVKRGPGIKQALHVGYSSYHHRRIRSHDSEKVDDVITSMRSDLYNAGYMPILGWDHRTN